MWRFRVLVAVAIVGVALGGCADDPQPITPPVAEPETVRKMADGGAEGVSEQTSARAVGEPGWMAGDMLGLVTKVSRNTDGHFVTIGRDADGHARRDTRGKRCAKIVLATLDDTRVLRGPGGDTPASASDIEEGQRVLASPGDTLAGPCPPLTGADRIVILGPG